MERARDFLWNNIPPMLPSTHANRKPPAPPLPPPPPPAPLKKVASITQVVETIDKDGKVVRTERVVQVGGGIQL